MLNPLLFIPGASALLFTAFEMPHEVKRVFFKIPIWLTSSAVAVGIGFIGRGVLGPATGFATELILFPGLYLAKKHFQWKDNNLKKAKEKNNVKKPNVMVLPDSLHTDNSGYALRDIQSKPDTKQKLFLFGRRKDVGARVKGRKVRAKLQT